MPTLTEKIIKAHLQEGTMDRGCPIAIKIDQTLTQDATGTMAYLQLEAMGVDQVKTFKIISLELTPLCNAPVSFTFTTFGIFKLNGRPAIAQATSSPPAPIANAPIPPAVGV